MSGGDCISLCPGTDLMMNPDKVSDLSLGPDLDVKYEIDVIFFLLLF